MNGKKARKMRKQVGYHPSKHSIEDYDVVDTSEVVGYHQRGVNPDGSPILQKVVAHKCTASVKGGTTKSEYRKLKKESK